jgi:sulfur-carrier protein
VWSGHSCLPIFSAILLFGQRENRPILKQLSVAPAPSSPRLAASSAPSVASLDPMPKIHIPTPLRQYAGKQAAVDVRAGTIADSLNDLIAQHPDLRRHLYTDEGKLRAFVNVYLNDEDVRYMQKEATPVKDSDTISIVPSIAGGR